MQTNSKAILLSAWLAFISRTAELPAINAPQSLLELSSFSTSFVAGQDARNHNIRLAAYILNGHTIAAGQIFSFNDTIGERTNARGFVKAPSIEFANKINLEGGGICLVSSLLYVNALLSGMEIIERYPHSRRVPYLLPGNDATVDFGLKDLKFKNALKEPVVIQTSITGTRLVIRFLSLSTLPYKIDLRSAAHLDENEMRFQIFRSRSQDGHVISEEQVSDDLYPTEISRRSMETPLEGGVSLSD
jgi:vancomycin resistance protein YoaR